MGTIGNLACSHGVIEADLRVVRKRDAKEGKAPEKTGAVQKLRHSDLVALHSGMLPDFAARSSVLT